MTLKKSYEYICVYHQQWLESLIWGGVHSTCFVVRFVISCVICYLYLFKHTGVPRDFHITLCSCRLTVLPRV